MDSCIQTTVQFDEEMYLTSFFRFFIIDILRLGACVECVYLIRVYAIATYYYCMCVLCGLVQLSHRHGDANFWAKQETKATWIALLSLSHSQNQKCVAVSAYCLAATESTELTHERRKKCFIYEKLFIYFFRKYGNEISKFFLGEI